MPTRSDQLLGCFKFYSVGCFKVYAFCGGKDQSKNLDGWNLKDSRSAAHHWLIGILQHSRINIHVLQMHVDACKHACIHA